MTVDMLAAAFIWPEDVLIGRTPAEVDFDPGAAEAVVPTEPDTMPFWAALMRRIRMEPRLPDAEPRQG